MMKYFMQFVLALAIAQMAAAAGAPAAKEQVNPSVDYMSASFSGSGSAALNVKQLSSPDSRLKYSEVGDLVSPEAAYLSELGDSDLLSASTLPGSTGMTGFDGTGITVNVPVDLPAADVGPVRVWAVPNSMRGSWSAVPTRISVPKTVREPPYGASPWTQSAGKPLGPEHYMPRRSTWNR